MPGNPIVIIGPTIQGEGALAGRPTIFVRTGGCDFRCTWRDSLHAVDPVHKANWKPRRVKPRISMKCIHLLRVSDGERR